MRVELNLNKFYKGLGQDSINKIFGSMLDIKTNIDKLKQIFELDRDLTYGERMVKEVSTVRLETKIRDLDSYMIELEKDTIFGTDGNIKLIDDEIIKSIIQKYEMLMSPHEKELQSNKENRKELLELLELYNDKNQKPNGIDNKRLKEPSTYKKGKEEDDDGPSL